MKLYLNCFYPKSNKCIIAVDNSRPCLQWAPRSNFSGKELQWLHLRCAAMSVQCYATKDTLLQLQVLYNKAKGVSFVSSVFSFILSSFIGFSGDNITIHFTLFESRIISYANSVLEYWKRMKISQFSIFQVTIFTFVLFLNGLLLS